MGEGWEGVGGRGRRGWGIGPKGKRKNMGRNGTKRGPVGFRDFIFRRRWEGRGVGGMQSPKIFNMFFL